MVVPLFFCSVAMGGLSRLSLFRHFSTGFSSVYSGNNEISGIMGRCGESFQLDIFISPRLQGNNVSYSYDAISFLSLFQCLEIPAGKHVVSYIAVLSLLV